VVIATLNKLAPTWATLRSSNNVNRLDAGMPAPPPAAIINAVAEFIWENIG
jgi:hypothetical protein